MIAKQNVRARIMQMIAEADKQIAAERARPAVKATGDQQSKGYRNYPRPRKTADVDDAPAHVLHEGDTEA